MVADGFEMPNGKYRGRRTLLFAWLTCSSGITFSPDGKYAYVSDSGIWKIGLNLAFPSSM